MRCSRAPRDAGFTLIEVLLSIVLLAAMLAMLPGTLGLGRRVWERTPALAAQDSATATRLLIEQMLSSALSVFESGPEGRFGVAFRGDPDGLMFLSEEPSGASGGGRYRSELLRAGNGDVVLLSTPVVRSAGGDPKSTAVVLARGTSGFKLRYYDDGVSSGWVDRWTRTTALPALIEVDMPGSAVTALTPIIVSPRLR